MKTITKSYHKIKNKDFYFNRFFKKMTGELPDEKDTVIEHRSFDASREGFEEYLENKEKLQDELKSPFEKRIDRIREYNDKVYVKAVKQGLMIGILLAVVLYLNDAEDSLAAGSIVCISYIVIYTYISSKLLPPDKKRRGGY